MTASIMALHAPLGQAQSVPMLEEVLVVVERRQRSLGAALRVGGLVVHALGAGRFASIRLRRPGDRL